MEKWRCQVDKANDIDLEIWDVKLIIPHVSQTNKYRGYIRCDYFIVTHCTIVYEVICRLFFLNNAS